MTKKKQAAVIESFLGNVFKEAAAGRGVPVLELGAIFKAGLDAFNNANGAELFSGRDFPSFRFSAVREVVSAAMAAAVDAAIAKAAGERFVIEAVAER